MFSTLFPNKFTHLFSLRIMRNDVVFFVVETNFIYEINDIKKESKISVLLKQSIFFIYQIQSAIQIISHLIEISNLCTRATYQIVFDTDQSITDVLCTQFLFFCHPFISIQNF